MSVTARVAPSCLPPAGVHARLLRSPEEQEACCDAEGRGAEAQGRTPLSALQNWQLILQNFAIFGGLVLDCIKTNVCMKICNVRKCSIESERFLRDIPAEVYFCLKKHTQKTLKSDRIGEFESF